MGRVHSEKLHKESLVRCDHYSRNFPPPLHVPLLLAQLASAASWIVVHESWIPKLCGSLDNWLSSYCNLNFPGEYRAFLSSVVCLTRMPRQPKKNLPLTLLFLGEYRSRRISAGFNTFKYCSPRAPISLTFLNTCNYWKYKVHLSLSLSNLVSLKGRYFMDSLIEEDDLLSRLQKKRNRSITLKVQLDPMQTIAEHVLFLKLYSWNTDRVTICKTPDLTWLEFCSTHFRRWNNQMLHLNAWLESNNAYDFFQVICNAVDDGFLVWRDTLVLENACVHNSIDRWTAPQSVSNKCHRHPLSSCLQSWGILQHPSL